MKLEFIKKYVEQETGIEDISSRLRTTEYAVARAIYMELARQYTRHSMSEIGELIGRDHSTVVYTLGRSTLTLNDPIADDIKSKFKKAYQYVTTQTVITEETVNMMEAMGVLVEENSLMRAKLVEVALKERQMNDFKDRLTALTEGMTDRQLYEFEVRAEAQAKMIKSWVK